MSGTRYSLEVNPKLPARLARLDELANNLRYSWDRPTRDLFSRLNHRLWGAVGHSPKAFLRRVSQRLLDDAAQNSDFLCAMGKVLSAYDSYHDRPPQDLEPRMAEGDLIAYFCAEFGFHESLPIYSGGLGILAGDHCKTASDMRLPFVGVGLLYRQGYFLQTIDGEGRQAATYHDSDFDELPLTPAVLDSGAEVHIQVELPGRSVEVKVWKVQVGLVTLYLLDTDLERNLAHDRGITHRLYGGDRTTRIEQEIILGVGGVRALRALGLHPTVWHINEGHAAFLLLERIRQLARQGLDFAAAMEATASNVVFTTHTAVPAGHDHFSEDMIIRYFESFASGIGCDIESLLALGRSQGQQEFNMTALALRCSSYRNGVSRIHGEVSSQICRDVWPQIDPEDNAVDHVTNGVHVHSFLSELWRDIFDRAPAPGWEQKLTVAEYWQGVNNVPDHRFWSTRQSIKAQMLHLVRDRIGERHVRNHGSQAHLDRLLRLADPGNPNILTIGFGRRFATYKRATLLFQNLDWLRQIVSDPERPVVFIFAGKAHPADEPGQALIRRITEVAAMPEFEAHILLVEGYDLHLGRRLVAGVDVWLNNPIYPLEASGTSGMKAAMNGVINLSVLDGWWGEGYVAGKAANGWAIKPVSEIHDDNRRDYEEARTLYELLQDKVVPLYYDRGPMGYSPGWVAMAKRSIATVVPRFNSVRMVGEYVTKFYQPAAGRWSRYRQSDFAGARQLATWKARIRSAWSGVKFRRLEDNSIPHRIGFGTGIRIEVALQLNKLRPEDIHVELLLNRQGDITRPQDHFQLSHQGPGSHGEEIYIVDLTPDICGKIEYRVRAYPHHELLSHPFEMGMMVWL